MLNRASGLVGKLLLLGDEKESLMLLLNSSIISGAGGRKWNELIIFGAKTE